MDSIKLIDVMNNPIEISKIILGGVPFGSTISKDKSFEIMDFYLSMGGNTIDTARVYCDWLQDGKGVSEKTIGQWMKSRNNRKNVNIITKGGHPLLNSMNTSRLSENEIKLDINLSLQALQTDYVDLYLLHRDDVNLPVSDIMDTLDNLVKEGKTRAIGASNWTVDRIKKANEYARLNNKTSFIISEIQWSLANCNTKIFSDDTMICMDQSEYQKYQKLGMPVIAFTSQAGGLFSCGYKPDLSDAAQKHKKYVTSENISIYKNLLTFCDKKNYKPSATQLNYIMDNELSAAAIIGCSSLEQLKDSMSASLVKLSKEDVNEIINGI